MSRQLGLSSLASLEKEPNWDCTVAQAKLGTLGWHSSWPGGPTQAHSDWQPASEAVMFASAVTVLQCQNLKPWYTQIHKQIHETYEFIYE